MWQTEVIDGLNCRTLKREAKRVVVLLHGYGASMDDLAPLAQLFESQQTSDWVFPNGPVSVPIGPMMSGSAWFPIDVAALESAMMTGSFRDYASVTPPGFLEAANQLKSFLGCLMTRYDDLILGGFSQGAMMSTELFLCQDVTPSRLVLFSGTVVSEGRWDECLQSRSRLPVFQSHGLSDPLLSFKEAERLRDKFTRQDFKVDFHSFQGGHEIPMDIIRAADRFLDSTQ